MKLMPPIHIDTISIAGHYLSALINGDYSGLSESDENDLDNWFKEYKDSGATYIFDVDSEDADFTTDCVTGLKADCYTVQVFEV